MIRSMFFGEIEQKSNIRFKIFVDSEIYNNAIDVDYDSEDVFVYMTVV